MSERQRGRKEKQTKGWTEARETMEILIIFLLIGGLLLGWFLLMRVEITTFVQRLLDASDKAPTANRKQATSVVRVVSARHASAPMATAELPDTKSRAERQSPESDGGIPKWSISE